MADEITAPEAEPDLDFLIPDELHDASDRACVIVCAAALETRLEQLITSRLVEGAAKPLFEGSTPPLSSFAAKIDMAHALGIIAEAETHDLHRIRKMRNAYAHTMKPLTFKDSPIAEYLRAIKLRPSTLVGAPPMSPRQDFESTFLALSGFLDSTPVVRIQPTLDLRSHFVRAQYFDVVARPSPRRA
jgi:hypothetical protein